MTILHPGGNAGRPLLPKANPLAGAGLGDKGESHDYAGFLDAVAALLLCDDDQVHLQSMVGSFLTETILSDGLYFMWPMKWQNLKYNRTPFGRDVGLGAS